MDEIYYGYTDGQQLIEKFRSTAGEIEALIEELSTSIKSAGTYFKGSAYDALASGFTSKTVPKMEKFGILCEAFEQALIENDEEWQATENELANLLRE